MLTSPQRRILNSARAVISGFDWGDAVWTAGSSEISALFDSTTAGLTMPATYYMQLRGVIGAELYAADIIVVLGDWGS